MPEADISKENDIELVLVLAAVKLNQALIFLKRQSMSLIFINYTQKNLGLIFELIKGVFLVKNFIDVDEEISINLTNRDEHWIPIEGSLVINGSLLKY